MRNPLLLVFAEVNKAHFVAIKIADVGTVEIGSVERSWAGIAFIRSTLGQSDHMRCVNLFLALTREANHVAVT